MIITAMVKVACRLWSLCSLENNSAVQVDLDTLRAHATEWLSGICTLVRTPQPDAFSKGQDPDIGGPPGV